MKRVFVCISLPKELKKKIWESFRVLSRFEEIKRVEEENYHITLKFLGYVGEEELESIKKTLEEIKHKPFFVKLSSIGYFKRRVLWVGVKEGENEIKNLAKKVQDVLGREDFHPHLTIGRIKKVMNEKRFQKLLEELRKIKFEETFFVDSFCLMESVLSKNGPIYIPIRCYKLEVD